MSATATLEQKRDYASCVQVLHPAQHASGGGGAFDTPWLLAIVGVMVIRTLIRAKPC